MRGHAFNRTKVVFLKQILPPKMHLLHFGVHSAPRELLWLRHLPERLIRVQNVPRTPWGGAHSQVRKGLKESS